MGVTKFRLYLHRKKVYLYTDYQVVVEPLMKLNRCNKQYSAKLTRWIDRLAHCDIAIQHIAGSDLKFTDYLSRNPLGGAVPEDKNDKECVINVLYEQAKLNLKYGQQFGDQSKDIQRTAERKNGTSERQSKNRNDQSQLNRKIGNKNNVNKIEQSVKVGPEALIPNNAS